MTTTEQDASPGADALELTIQEFLDRGQKAGNYPAALERVLLGANGETTGTIPAFTRFLEARGIDHVTAIDKRDLVAYADHLADAVADAADRTTTTDGIPRRPPGPTTTTSRRSSATA
jgi:hypothetical protein